MAEKKYQITVRIGAALDNGFNSAVSGSTAKIRQIGVAIKDVDRQSALASKSVGKMTTRTDRLLTSLNGGKQLFATPDFYRSEIMALVGLAAAFTVPIKAAMDYQDALAGIKSVVNFPDPKELEQFGDQLSDLSREIPVTANELAAISAIGGRFGVPLKELTIFSKEVGKTAVAWGASVNDTAERVGNLMKVFKASTAELPTYFDAINELGNKTGATADQILQAVNRSADGLANFKLSIPQVAALTSTLISFGEGAETAGNSVSTMLQKLSIAPQLGKNAQKALHSIGLSSVTLPKLIQEDPQKVIDKLLTGLSKLDPENRSSAMYNIFGRGASKAVGKLVDNLDLYRKNLGYVANQKLFKGSRDSDYNIVFDTLRSKIKLLTNTISSLMRAIGFSLAPGLTKIITAITDMLKPLAEWVTENKDLLSYLVTTAVKLTALRFSLLGLRFVASSLFGTMNQAGKAFACVRWAVSLASFALKMFFFGWFGKSLTVGAAIYSYFGGLSKITGVQLATNIGNLANKFKVFASLLKIKLGPALKVLWSEILAIGSVFGNVLRPEIRALITLAKNFAIAFVREMKPIWAIIKESGGKGLKLVLEGISSAFQNSGGVIKNTGKLILPTIAAFGLFKGVFLIFGKFGRGLIGSFFGGFHKILEGSLILLRTFFGIVWRLGSIALPVLWEGLKLVAQLFWFFVSDVIPVVLNGIWGLARGLVLLATEWIPTTIAVVGRLSKTFLVMARSALAPIIASITKFTQAIRTLVVSGFMRLEKAFPLVGIAIRSLLIASGIATIIGIAYLIIKNWEKIKKVFIITGRVIAAVWRGLVEGLSEVWEIFSTLGRLLWQAIKFSYNLGLILLSVGENLNALVDRFIFGKDVTIPAWEKVKELFENFWNNIISEWDKFLEKIKKLSFTDTIIKAWNSVKSAFNSFWNDSDADSFIEKTKELEFTDKIVAAWNSVKQTFENFWRGSEWEKLFEKIKKLEFTDGIVAAWEKVKNTFENLFKDILPSWNSITDSIKNFFGKEKSLELKTVSGSKSITSTNRPAINARNANGDRNLKNNTTINITQNIGNGDPKPIAKETAKEVANVLGGIPLYDLASV